MGSYREGLHFVNLEENYFPTICGLIDQRSDYKSFALNDKFFSTINNKNLKIWNVDSGEEIFTYHGIKSKVTCAYFNSQRNKLFCCFENNNEIALFSLDKLGYIDSFIIEETINTNRKHFEFAICWSLWTFNDKPSSILITNIGNVFMVEINEYKGQIIHTKVIIKLILY